MENSKSFTVKLPENCMESSPLYKQSLLENLKCTNKKFTLASKQVVKLNETLLRLQECYERARRNDHPSYTYFMRLRYVTMEGVRNMYFEYVVRCAQFMQALYEKLEELQVDIEEFDSSDTEDSEEVNVEFYQESEAVW